MPATRTNRFLIGAAAAIGVLAGAAGISAAVTGAGDDDPAPDLARAESEAVAVAEVPGTVVGIEADDVAGRAVWSVEVQGEDGRRHELDVAEDGTVVARDVDDDDDDDDGARADGTPGTDDGVRADDGTGPVDDDAPVAPEEATVSQADAEATALATAPGEVRRTHLDREDGRVVWDVEVVGADGLEHEVHVDATTGDVVEHDTDDLDDD